MPKKIIDHNLGPVEFNTIKTVEVYNQDPVNFPADSSVYSLGMSIDGSGDVVFRSIWPHPTLAGNLVLANYIITRASDGIIPDSPPVANYLHVYSLPLPSGGYANLWAENTA